ncbi:MAG: hypothetical protein IPK87_05985 [Planctomycetes bacterium]|nr:hypothetical protein [Planctomycetota bacterium]
MARLSSPDNASWFELTPVHTTRGGGADGVVCEVKFEAYGEPVNGELTISHDGLTRMVEKLLSFGEKRAGMMQLRSDTRELEISLAARRSKWTQKINVTGLAGVPNAEAEPEGALEEVRASVGVTYRQHGGAGNVEHRCGMHCTFDALIGFAQAISAELAAAPRRTGRVEPS